MFRATLWSVLIVTALGGCSKIIPKLDEVVPDNRKDYRRSESLPDLEVPPDLSTDAIRDRMAIPEGGDTAKFSTFQERKAERQREKELELAETSAIRVLENEHVLAVEGAAVQVWPKIREFWQGLGYELELDDVELGVVETAWAEDESQLKRDKYKVFAEPGENVGTTVLYVSHEGQELVPQGEDLVWQRSARNAELERTVVERLQEHMSGGSRIADTRTEPVSAPASDAASGASQPNDSPVVGGTAPTTSGPRHAELVSVGGGKVYLTVAEDFPRAWKTTGRALEQAGISVKDSDKGRGVYIIEMEAASAAAPENENQGVWNKLKFWDRKKGSELQVSLTGVGEKTEVVVLDKDGRWETGDNAGRLLSKLQDALNSGRI